MLFEVCLVVVTCPITVAVTEENLSTLKSSGILRGEELQLFF